MSQNLHFFSWDDRRDIAHPGDRAATVTFCVEHFVSCAKEAIGKHGFFAVALSGGSTPEEVYRRVTHPPHVAEIDWTKCLLFWSDERNTLPTKRDSNFWMAMEAGFKATAIPPSQVFRMHAEEAMEKHAEEYEKLLKNVLDGRPLDLILLGVGADGHTASLFPNTPALEETHKWVVANPVPQKNTTRMTLTYPCIHRSINIVIYALGAEKSSIVRDVFLKPEGEKTPVAAVGTPISKALWVMDSDAGKDLLLHRKDS